ncbi:MAG: hypothetical protein LUF26_07955 [Firmicutes bacterium]|nr:hypothetical protein [Bacillota bacterium]
MNKARVIITIIIVVLALSLSGCMGTEPNEIAYIVALGIDEGDNDSYKITVQYAKTAQISGGASEEGGKAGSEIVDNVTVEAPNIYSGIGTANYIVSKTFSLSHAKLIVFSEEVAEKGLKSLIETFARSDELRPDVFIAVAVGGANEYLTSVNPEMEVNPAQYYQLIYQKNNLMGIPSGEAKDFFFGISTGDYDSIIPVAGVIETQESDGSGSESSESGGSEGGGESGGGDSEGGGESSRQEGDNEKEKEARLNKNNFEYNIKNYIAGEASVEKKNKSEEIGSAIFEDDKMVGLLGSVETEICQLINGDYTYSYMTFYDEENPEIPATIKAAQEKKPKYNIDLDNKRIEIELFIEGDLYSLPSEYNVENRLEKFEEEAQSDISEACTEFINNFFEKYNSDIFNLKRKTKSKFMTNAEYEEFKESVDFKEYEISVKANFKIRRTGLVIKEEK